MKNLLMLAKSAFLLSAAFFITVFGISVLSVKDNPPIYFNTIAASCEQE